MAEYIDKEALMADLEKFAPECKAAILIAGKQPKADVSPVRRTAIADRELVFDMWACSECGFDADGSEEKPRWKFCPNCGAYLGGADNAAD